MDKEPELYKLYKKELDEALRRNAWAFFGQICAAVIACIAATLIIIALTGGTFR